MGKQWERQSRHYQTYGLLNGVLGSATNGDGDSKVENVYFNLIFQGEETNQESIWLCSCKQKLLIHLHPSVAPCRHKHRVAAFSL